MITDQMSDIIDLLKRLGFTRHERERTWHLVNDPAGPEWYCLQITLPPVPGQRPQVTMAGTADGCRKAAHVRALLRPMLRHPQPT